MLSVTVAGALGVPARSLTLRQVIGGVLCAVGPALAGYALGSSVPGVEHCLLPVVALIVAVSLPPLPAEILRAVPRPGGGPARARDGRRTAAVAAPCRGRISAPG